MNIDQIRAALEAPFPATEIKWKPQQVKGDRAMVIAYITARAVMDRLDAVLGPDQWRDHFDVLQSGDVVCTLTCRLDGEWVQKMDVGSQSEQPDDGDKLKAAFSDALKRAAVKFGVGRYLYRLPHQWVDYDAQKRTLKATPGLPSWALPGKAAAPNPATKPVPASREKIGALIIAARDAGFTEAQLKTAAKVDSIQDLTDNQVEELSKRIIKAAAPAGVKT